MGGRRGEERGGGGGCGDGRGLAIVLVILMVTRSVTCGMGLLELFMNYGLKTSFNIRTIATPAFEDYDFIVIGAGSGGSTVANRLSENGNWRILLLEAGKPEGILNQIPVLVNFFQQTDYNWGYRVEPQKNACLGMIDHRCTWPRGKSLGGTSTLNYMIHTRGNKLDYDNWAALGNKEWSYEEVLPYFRKSERFRITGPYNASYHGRDGNVCVEHVPTHTPLSTEFLNAGKILGYEVLDYNGPKQVGFSYIQVNMDRGSRCSASRAYLKNNRVNLDIITLARVTKVLIDSKNQAYGVKYIKDRKTQVIRAKKEVILSAGTIDSAKLLMLSGIGPRDHLEQLGIKVIQDAKVGFNLYEHIGFLGLVFKVNTPVTLKQTQLFNPKHFIQYSNNRSGLFSIPGGAESLAFIRTRFAKDSRPDLELLFVSGSLHSDYGISVRRSFGITDDVYYSVFKPIENEDAWSIWPIAQQPRSHGRIKLKSKNPFDNPEIQPNFFSNPYDVEMILEGIKIAINISKTEPFQKYNSQIHDIKIPGCRMFTFGSDDYFRCAIKHLPAMMNHEIGTCKMGPSSDPDAVVDPQLKVHGIKNLRVVDASIMPMMPIGHVNAGIYMIGEKAADMIKQTWNN